jgi:predicted ATP-grasp superfamily ATP-dependent carboligase
LKILIFEYLCGGGFAGQDLPASLAAEGSMMLQALLTELKQLPQHSLLLPMDERCRPQLYTENTEIVPIHAGQNIMSLLPELIRQCDAVWPIAPESDGILAEIALLVTAQQKILLASSAATITLCGDKYATYQTLLTHGLPVVETALLQDFQPSSGKLVIKPRDGVGCLGGMISDDLNIKSENPAQFIVQPFYAGQALSLSCLCKQGKGRLLSINQQQIQIIDNRFVLNGCLVNISSHRPEFYQQVVSQVAAAIPGLWGYIGIDLLDTPDKGPLILEINPRLTTSYVGIAEATGVNVARQVLALLEAEPEAPPVGSSGKTVKVSIS